MNLQMGPAMNDTYQAPLSRRFEGRVVMVTGAGTGFGRALAVRAAGEGARVIVHYHRSAAGAEETADLVGRVGGSEALVVRADISVWDDVRRIADQVFEEVGRLDALINNAGDVAPDQMSWRDVTEEVLDRVLAVDIKGTMLMIHEFGSRMLDQGHGSIVNIGSTVVARGSPRAPQYAASKYALLGLTKSYARAFAPTVRVNTFAPGFMETARTLDRDDWQGGRREQLISMTPMGRIPGPDELASGALFLASNEASHMTGGFVAADGGYNMIGA